MVGNEWEGAKSQHFPPPKRLIEQQHEFLDPPGGLLTYTSAGLETVKGKRHYEEKFGVPQGPRRPCIKKVPPLPRPPERVQSMKYIKPEFSENPPRPERAHVTQIIAPSSRPEMPIHTRTVRTASGERVRDARTEEYDFHKTQMGRKGSVKDMRNGMPLGYKGDKSYGEPEYATGFFRDEGLFPRAVYRPRLPVHVKGSASSYSSLVSYEATRPSRKKWSERLQEAAEAENQAALSSLLEWERTILKEKFPGLKDPEESDEDESVYAAKK